MPDNQSFMYQSFNGRESFKNINSINNHNKKMNAKDLFGLSQGTGLVIKSLSKQYKIAQNLSKDSLNTDSVNSETPLNNNKSKYYNQSDYY